jgi:hypothetical protein
MICSRRASKVKFIGYVSRGRGGGEQRQQQGRRWAANCKRIAHLLLGYL